MHRLLVLCAVLLSVVTPSAQAPAPSRTITVTANDDMKFNLTEIMAKPGETLRIRLLATGTAPKSAMAHNFVILNAGTNQLVFADAAAKAVGTDYIPPALKSSVLATTILIGNGESAEVIFKVPAKAGNYPFLCSFPGHFAAGARGKIVVQ
jgi:azurin